MTEDNSTTPLKHCPKCNQNKPATPQFFHRTKKAPDGLNWWCKVCFAEYKRQYDKTPAAIEKERQRRQSEEYREYHREYNYHYTRTSEQRARRALRARERYRDDPEYRAWRKVYDHSEVRKAKALVYSRRPEVKARQREADARFRQTAKRKAYIKDYYLQRRHDPQRKQLLRVCANRRRARKLALPDTWTKQHWLYCLDYWHNSCAVCGGQLRGLFDIEPHADHWIPLSHKDCPGTIPDNMICLCSSCNSSKHNKLPETWLMGRYGGRKSREILSRVNIYFKWIVNQEVNS